MLSAVKDADGQLRGFAHVARDLTERMRAERAQAFLAEAGQVLAASLDYRTTLEEFARLVTRQLADCCIVAVKAGAELQPVAFAHRDTEPQRALERIVADLPPDAPLLRGMTDAMRKAEAILSADVADAPWISSEIAPASVPLIKQLGIRSCMCVPMVVHGDALGVVAFLSSLPGRHYDARDLRLAEELARRAAFAVENARLYDNAKAAVRTREEVLAVVSHDLRGPLSTILLSARQFLDEAGNKDTPAAQTLARIARSSQRMTHMIADLLDFSSIEASRLTLEPRDCSARDLVRDALEIYEPLAKEKDVRLDDRTGSLDVHLHCDPNRIVQVLSNLLGNAIKFTPASGTVTLEAVVAEARRTITFKVSDTGRGVPPEDLPYLFDRYWQAKRRAQEGIGLGLAIVKGLVEAHGGSVTATSRPGAGSTFSFTLPLPNAEETGTPA
jgi:signal transduction histidine kinase